MNKEAIIALARTRLAESIDADRENREDALDDLKNIAGFQWLDSIREARETAGKPCITINRLPQFVRQVTGDIRQLNPAINVIPADNAASDEIAQVIEGVTRQIEYSCDASSIYENAAESAAQCGMGYFRVLTQYESDDSFNQEIKLETIHNPFSVYFDPEARKSTREDGMYCFIATQVPEDTFKEDYPGASIESVEIDGNTDGLEHWRDGSDVIVSEYFWKEPFDIEIGLMRDGKVIEKPQAIHDIVKKRTVTKHKVMWAKITGNEVLEGPTEFPCKHIPVIGVMGEEMHIGDRRVRTSVIRFAKDPQQLYNYYSSAQAETIALQPKTPYILSTKQVAGYENDWAAANDDNTAYLLYNPDEKAGVPQRSQPPVASQALAQEAMKAAEDMKATTGIFDAGLGQRSNEQSGVAIRQRQMESDISTSIYTDNLSKAIGHCGRILVDMIPQVYDTNRIVRIVGKDDSRELIEVNGQRFDPMTQEIYDMNPLKEGKYDVRVDVGPNYTTRRQETAESMMQFVQAFPAAGQVAGDLIVRAMEWPDADKLAERLEKILPPGMVEQSQDPQAQQQMMQQQQQAQMQEQQAQQAQQAAQQIEMRKAEAEAQEAEAQAQAAQFKAQEAQFKMMSAQRDATQPSGPYQLG